MHKKWFVKKLILLYNKNIINMVQENKMPGILLYLG